MMSVPTTCRFESGKTTFTRTTLVRRERRVSELIGPEEVQNTRETGQLPTVIDVRGQEEYEAGHLPGALHIPADELPQRLAKIPSDRGSSRSERAAELLREGGYRAQAVSGGFLAWEETGLPVEGRE